MTLFTWVLDVEEPEEMVRVSDSRNGQATLSLTRVLGHLERQLARRLDEVLAPEGLTVDQWRVLDLLSDDEGYPMSVIAAHIAVPGATLTKLIDRLVEGALVYRRVGEVDRRRVLVHLAARGRQAHTRLTPEVERVEREQLAPLRADAELVMDLLERLARPTLPELISSE
jgi:DNA-binding MarR family transcriptional regulator